MEELVGICVVSSFATNSTDGAIENIFGIGKIYG
jgi:hypothetical protein